LEDKNFLQSIKLEISKNFQLNPYERIAFHRVFSNIKSEGNKKTLIKELENDGHVKRSAVIALSVFQDDDISEVLVGSIDENSHSDEILAVMNYLKNTGSEKDILFLIELLENLRDKNYSPHVILNIFEVLRIIGSGNSELFGYLQNQLARDDNTEEYIFGAFNALSGFENISFYDDLIKTNDDNTICFIFQSIYKLNINLRDPMDNNKKSIRDRYIDRPLNEYEELVLKIKVFLGKNSGKFDNFSNTTKIAYINALLSCNHRESNIFISKIFGSNEKDLISMTLYSVYNNVSRLSHPEKLFRSLISMNIEDEQDNDLITEIIIKYFNENNSSRSDLLFMEKEFGFISVTLESYFETYRREFMIPEVMEKAFPENFRKVRDLLLRKLNPEYKRKLNTFLYTQESERSKNIIKELSNWVYYVDDKDNESLSLLIDILIDEDTVSRENSANRLDSVNFEKRYLQSRIIRLCKIISSLKIENASRSLVYIYNYLKKYPEPEIYEAVTYSLCRLNYSYMLSEIEIMLSAGSPEDQKWAVQQLGLFTEKRLINILVDYINRNIKSEDEIICQITVIISGQEIKRNINVAESLKNLIENNSDIKIKKYAILGLGNCGFTDDIEYLKNMYSDSVDSNIKESILKSIIAIITENDNIKKQTVIKYANDFLRDPGIKVRIFSCIILLQLGDKEALKYIRDMLIIKNKSVQREILSILKDIQSPDFYFFLVSLLRNEYAISRDIIGILTKLSQDDMKEIDNFLVNLFRKFESPSFGDIPSKKEVLNIDGVEKLNKSLLYIKKEKKSNISEDNTYYDSLKWNLIYDSLLLPAIMEKEGVISYKIDQNLTVIFENSKDAVLAAMDIKNRLNEFNNKTEIKKNILIRMSVSTGNMSILNDEIFSYQEDEFINAEGVPVLNRIIIDDTTADLLKEEFHYRSVPEILYSQGLSGKKHFEVLSEKNFLYRAMDIFNGKIEKRKEEEELAKHIREQVKSLNSENRSKTSISIASDLEDIGVKLRDKFQDIEKYVIGRSTDRELTKNVSKMLNNIYDLYRIEVSKLTIK